MVSSDVWRFCTRLTNNNVKCNHCGRVMSYHGTTNLRVHIARHFGIRPQRNLFGRILKGNIQLPPLVSKDQNHLDIPSGRNKKQHSDLLAVKQELQDSVTRPHSPIPPSSSKHPMEVCLRWFTYQTNMQDALPIMLLNEQFVDVTLAAEGQSVKCHKVILSACSPYFEKLLSENPCEHPIIIMKDLKFSHIQALVDFMYNGEVNVIENELPSLLAAAKTLQIKGLAEAKTRLPFGDVPPIENIPLQICLNESVSNVAHPISPSQKSRGKHKRRRNTNMSPSSPQNASLAGADPLVEFPNSSPSTFHDNILTHQPDINYCNQSDKPESAGDMTQNANDQSQNKLLQLITELNNTDLFSSVDKFKKEFDDCVDPSAFDLRNPEEQETVHMPENPKENDCSLESVRDFETKFGNEVDNSCQ
uniref:BTB domain-containing protein n=1 Tax=Timema tahoe TaxID=61484 RepID=A0A7R9IAC1_9NEOP|nr:unnamed protein product [Timema tahoe]